MVLMKPVSQFGAGGSVGFLVGLVVGKSVGLAVGSSVGLAVGGGHTDGP